MSDTMFLTFALLLGAILISSLGRAYMALSNIRERHRAALTKGSAR